MLKKSNKIFRILLLPVIAGVSYEFNRFAGKHVNWFTKILRAPGMAMQHFTTIEPEDDMIEVAIVALNKALEYEKNSQTEKTYSALDNEHACCEEPSCNEAE